MTFLFREFDRSQSRAWVLVQVLLIGLILVGIGLLCTERYWLSPVVSFLLASEKAKEMSPLSPATGTESYSPETPILPANVTEIQPIVIKPTPSSNSSSMNTPSSQFAITVPHTAERGHPVVISWQLPAETQGGSIGFFLDGDAFPVERPLTLKTIPLSGASGSFTWDGERYGCDPLDHPTYCTDIATGEYTITARVYDKTDVSLIDGDPIVPVVHDEKALYTAGPVPLSIGGLPSSDRVDTFKQVLANKINTDFLKEANPNMLWDSTATAQENMIKPYIKQQSAFTGPDVAGKFCMNFTLTEPFAGTFKVCGPDITFYRDTAAKFTVTGDFSMTGGVISYQTAKNNVLEKIWSLYQKRVAFKDRPTDAEAGYTGDPESYKSWFNAHPDAGTYLLTEIEDWAYRTKGALGESRTTPWSDESYWVFKVQAQKMGSADVVPDKFNDRLIVRVNNDGSVCVAQAYPYLTHTGSVLDIRTDVISCP